MDVEATIDVVGESDIRRMVNHPANFAPRERGLNAEWRYQLIAARFTGRSLSQGLESLAMPHKK